MSQPLILGIAIVIAASICFLLLVMAAIVVGYHQVGDQEGVAVEDELRKAGM